MIAFGSWYFCAWGFLEKEQAEIALISVILTALMREISAHETAWQREEDAVV